VPTFSHHKITAEERLTCNFPHNTVRVVLGDNSRITTGLPRHRDNIFMGTPMQAAIFFELVIRRNFELSEKDQKIVKKGLSKLAKIV
jgi:hypothetical protein